MTGEKRHSVSAGSQDFFIYYINILMTAYFDDFSEYFRTLSKISEDSPKFSENGRSCRGFSKVTEDFRG